ncbi:FtsQ-type POTRA domain-containing protein [Oerskovia sp. Sa1BUA8]|uniref:FtsQ-type POTRA domain-containing protein n=1 Tax=Oerskovia douganii TaxID=2762210 RepID=A0A9D5YWW3_9CELL|nr:cell division protein FtsQ/DivIB [Oerskovia douganii]MBE7698948.1 FtsQ-type POTRA domain-containing protein [Oerskovia douganii]
MTQPLVLRGSELVPAGDARPAQGATREPSSTGPLPLVRPQGVGRGARPVDRVVSTGMADRLAEKAAMRRHRLRTRILAWSAAVAVVVAGVWVVMFSPVLGTDPAKVSITGEGTVIDLAQVQGVVSGAAGVPLPRVDTIGLRDEILGLNGVRDVQILRAWPDGLTVTLESREPVAAVPDEGRFALLDRDGVRVATVDAVPDGLPEIGVTLDEQGARSLRAARIVLNVLPPELRAEVAEVTAQTQDAVEMTLRDGAVVEWGNEEDAALKVKVLQALRALPDNQGVRLFDVSAPTMPITQ